MREKINEIQLIIFAIKRRKLVHQFYNMLLFKMSFLPYFFVVGFTLTRKIMFTVEYQVKVKGWVQDFFIFLSILI